MERGALRWAWLIACALLACAGTARAKSGCTLEKYGSLPVQVIGERATTEVKINGVDTRFMLDTGAEFSFMSAATADALKLPRYPAPFGFFMRGIGGESDVDIATAKDFGILGTVFHRAKFLVGGSDTGRGVLGANLLDFADLELNLAQGEVAFFRPEHCRKAALAYWAKGGNYNVAKLLSADRQHDKRSFVDVTINGKQVRALLDSGAPATVLSRRAAERVGLDLHGPGVRAGGLTHGVGAKSYPTWIVPVAKFSVGTETIQHSEMLVMDGPIGDGSIDMLLGIDFMLAHRMYIANSQREIYFTYNGGRMFSRDTASIGAHESPAPATSTAGSGPDAAADDALRGQAHLARGELAQARADLDAALRLDPKSSGDHLIRARILLAQRQPDAALADLDTALSLDPKNLDALLLRARLRYRKHDDAGVAADIAAARELAPAGSMHSYAIASLYIAIGQPASALPLLDAWIRTHDEDALLGRALNACCWARALADQALKGAVHDCRKAIRRDGDRSAYLDSLGMAYLRLGDDAKAIKAYQRALAQSPRVAWSHFGLGLAEWGSGQTSAGKAELATARSLDPKIDVQAAKFGLVAPAAPPASGAPAAPASR